MPDLARFRAKRDDRAAICRRKLPFCTWTWMRFLFRWNCWNGRNCAASRWWLAEGRISAAWFPPRVTKRGNLEFSRRCRCERPGNFVPHAIFLDGHHAKYARMERPCGHYSERNFLRWWRWFRSTRRISISPELNGCTGRRSLPRTNYCAPLRTTTGLPCSAGLASTRLVAKVASEQAKPRGLLWVAAGAKSHDFLRSCRCEKFLASAR